MSEELTDKDRDIMEAAFFRMMNERWSEADFELAGVEITEENKEWLGMRRWRVANICSIREGQPAELGPFFDTRFEL